MLVCTFSKKYKGNNRAEVEPYWLLSDIKPCRGLYVAGYP